MRLGTQLRSPRNLDLEGKDLEEEWNSSRDQGLVPRFGGKTRWVQEKLQITVREGDCNATVIRDDRHTYQDVSSQQSGRCDALQHRHENKIKICSDQNNLNRRVERHIRLVEAIHWKHNRDTRQAKVRSPCRVHCWSSTGESQRLPYKNSLEWVCQQSE